MDHAFCPGSKLLRQPAPEIFNCPTCAAEVEIWTDEFRGDCSGCGKTVFRDAAMSCLDWCKYAQECVGDATYDRYMVDKAVSIKRQLLARVEEYFGDDPKRIGHAKQVLHRAEELLQEEKADWHVVIPASLLHDVGIKVAEEKYGSSNSSQQEQEGPPVARKMLLKLGLKMDDIDQVCDIIAHHHSPGQTESLNFRVLYDADCLVNMEGRAGDSPEGASASDIKSLFLTQTGKRLAREIPSVTPGDPA